MTYRLPASRILLATTMLAALGACADSQTVAPKATVAAFRPSAAIASAPAAPASGNPLTQRMPADVDVDPSAFTASIFGYECRGADRGGPRAHCRGGLAQALG